MAIGQRQPSQIRRMRLEQVYRLIEQTAGEGITIAAVRESLQLNSDFYVRAMLFDMVEMGWLDYDDGAIIHTKAGLRMGLRFFIRTQEVGS